MPVKIKRFSISNYRSCQRSVICLDDRLTALIGPNGSGKTNLLNALLLLKQLPSLGAVGRKGGLRTEADEGAIKCSLKVDFEVARKIIRYKASIKYNISATNVERVDEAREVWNFSSITGRDKWQVIPEFIPARRSWTPSALLSHRHLVRLNYLPHFRGLDLAPMLATAFSTSSNGKFTVSEKNYKQLVTALRAIHGFISNINYYRASQYTDPAECPASIELGDDDRLRDRYGVSAPHVNFLFDLYTVFKSNLDVFREYVSLVGKEGLGLIDQIKFPSTTVPSSEVEVRVGGRLTRKRIKRTLVIPKFIINKTILSPSQLSEGTFRTLAMLLYLTTDKSTLLLLEEPEVCIHHGLLASVMELVKSYAAEKQIVISTHSDYVLDHLSPKNVFLVRNFRGRGTTVQHLPRAMSVRGYEALKEYLRSAGNLGEYWRSSGFESV